MIRTRSNQDGITLLMAIVILSTMTFLSFSLSTIILREIGASQLLLKTEPAIAAAYAGSEVGIYKFLRQKPPIDSSGAMGAGGGTFQINSKLYDDPYLFTIPGVTGLNVAYRYMYDASDINHKEADYGTVTISNTGAKQFTIVVSSVEDVLTPICTATLSQGQSLSSCPLYDPTGSGDDRYQLFFNWTDGPAISGTITTTSRSTGLSRGFPSDAPILYIIGSGSGVERKLEVNLQP